MSILYSIFVFMVFALEYMINIIFTDEVKSLFGDDSYVNIDSIRYSTNLKTFVVHTKVLISDITSENTEDFKSKLTYLVTMGWRYLGKDEPLTIISSIDVK